MKHVLFEVGVTKKKNYAWARLATNLISVKTCDYLKKEICEWMLQLPTYTEFVGRRTNVWFSQNTFLEKGQWG